MKKVLIIGITGQDGSNFARYLLKYQKNLEIYGSYNSDNKLILISDIIKNIHMLKIDLYNFQNIEEAIKSILPDYIINFSAAQPQFENNNINFFKINTLSTIHILDCIVKYKTNIKYFSAGSSLEFNNEKNIINLNDKSEPNNIYGITKFSNRLIINYYKNKYNLFLVHSVLFNHDSASRTDDFISKKIINNLKNIKECVDNNDDNFESIEINNIFTYRDWSDSRDFVEAIWLMMNTEKPNNYILSSGIEYSLYDFINICLNILNFKDIEWKKEDLLTILYYKNKKILISLNSTPFKGIVGDNSETKILLNWNPRISFKNMINDIINNYIY
jgi:GDPmannose 4,6-dehydratase